MSKTMDLIVEFTLVRIPYQFLPPLTYSSGGLEMLFSDKRKHEITIPVAQEDGSPSTAAFLIEWLCDNLMKDPRKEMFVLDNTVYALAVIFDT